MTAPILYLVPHGEDGHFESRACADCREFLDELARLDRQMLELCACGLAEVVSTDHRGERSYRLTSSGLEWIEAQKIRRGSDR
ncbi:MAG: hypothetical protein C0506_03630 [Anaerolinea sp.]|jgi:hypothetical protein|nr:hypothetical protein [Anaerolinea sp.]